jgi:methyl-accepting chemotaxis protein
MKNVYMSDTNTQKRSARQIQSFASYVTSHSIKATDTQALRAWQEQHDNVYILIYNNNDIVFDSDWMIEKKGAYKYVITNSETGEIIILLQDNYGNIRKIKRKASSSSESQKKSDAVTADEGAYYGNSSMLRGDLNEFDYDFYPVLFKDGVFDVCIVDYSDDTIKDVGEIAIFVICCILFIGVIIVYFGREIGRMRRLTNEVMDIKDVDINGPITIHGQDEICMLAENVDTMRQTIIEQLSR